MMEAPRSIGANTLEVVAHLRQRGARRFDIVGLATGANAESLAAQAERFDCEHVAIADDSRRAPLKDVRHVYAGESAACELIDAVARPGDLVVGAMVGSAGVPATIAAIERGCDIALANKETLVAAGAIVMPLAREHEVHLLPVDSEHSAIFQCLLAGRSLKEGERVVLTASGGPFREAPLDEIRDASVEQALDHPTWNMGAKVTIDSATLMNKALEVIEAHWLFDLPAERIEAIIHPQSIVHSFVEFVDGSVFAQLSPPDMRSPIQYALTWPDRVDGCARRLDWRDLRSLEFEPVDHERFPSIRLAKSVIEREGTAGAVFNAANEAAVAAFLDRSIPFGRITEVVAETCSDVAASPVASLDDVLKADVEARETAGRLIATGAPARAYG